MQDLLGNHINLTFTTLLTAGLQIRGGLLVPLAVTSTDAPSGLSGHRDLCRAGICRRCAATPGSGSPGRAGFRRSWCTQLNQETRRIVKTPKMQEQFNKLSLLTQDLDPAGVTKFVADEYAYLGAAGERDRAARAMMGGSP